jgi:Pectate lyase superfamily protein
MRKLVLLGIALVGTILQSQGASVYTERIDDSRAVYLTRSEFGVRADGKNDDTEALQAAINKVQETTGEGILFVPEGRYRITRTVYVWPGIRVIGYGRTRPVMVLADNTPGYQKGVADMFFYAGYRPGDRRSAAAAAFPELLVLSPFTVRKHLLGRFLPHAPCLMRTRAPFTPR